jgi:hypothetical protein
MTELSLHDFHCVLDRNMKERLRDFDIFKTVRGVSGKVVKILQVLIPVIRRELKWGEQRKSRYMNVCDDPDVVRDHVHVYMPGGLYRELKLLHQGLNFYSVAQFLRGLLEWFFKVVEECDGDVLQELEKLFASWAAVKNETRLTLKAYMRQLLTIVQHLPGKNRLVIVYNQNYSPFWVLRI